MESAPPPQPQPQSPPHPPQPPALGPLTPSEERTWAMLAHLSILLNLVTGLLGPVGALIIYLVYKDRSRYVAYHSLQSLIFQLIAWVGGGILTGIAWTITGLLSAILVGLLCIPIALVISLIPLGALIYGIIGGIQCNQGQDFRYWLVGDWMRETLTG
jgi:uncharacterized Tic20 family protein